jgi:hypothetical protein
MIFLVVIPCSSERTEYFREIYASIFYLLFATAGFLFGLLFSSEDGGNMFLQNIELSPDKGVL